MIIIILFTIYALTLRKIYKDTPKNIKEKIEFFRMMQSANFEKWQKLSFF